ASAGSLGLMPSHPLAAEAPADGQAAGIDTAGPGKTRLPIANLGAEMLGMASGHAIWPDDNAGGRGWFSPTPEQAESPTPGQRGEPKRLDLPTVLTEEAGRLPGREGGGAMALPRPTGVRHSPTPLAELALLDQAFAAAVRALSAADGMVALPAGEQRT
ncbi:MAG TPA: hypothetical protein VKD72_23425, partial [Gemmataceae bacterium]|nr:hypothetical protein [Gemmataceae bacterium]